jgi:excinuclease ABC subunit C
VNERIEKKLDSLPESPGVYIMKGAAGRVIYVGKALNLRDRVRSYFAAGTSDERAFVPLLSDLLDDLDVIITRTEKEAYLLENELIKKYRPKFNVRLRDDKNYLSLRLDLRQEFPRIERIRRPRKDGARYFGPFVSAREARQMLRMANRRFGLRTCSEVNFRNRSRPCMQGQMRRCIAPCVKAGEVKESYAEAIRRAALFLSGRDEELIPVLAEAMKRAAARLDYEEAAALRDTISAMETSRERQGVLDPSLPDSDSFGLAFDGKSASVCVLSFRGGRLLGKRCYDFDEVSQTVQEVLAAIVGQYYTGDVQVPQEVLLPEPPDGIEALEEILADKRGAKVSVLAPARGPRKDLVEMAARNADHHLKLVSDRDEVLEEIRRRFALKRFPRVIECYDISHLGGTNTVAARVVFVNGAPDKELYRHYHIREETAGDDMAAMHEVLSRRFSPQSGETAPDLVLIDGGKAQLGTAADVMKSAGLFDRIDLLSIAKGDRVKGDAIYLPGRKNPVWLGMRSKELHLLMRVRDEAHRFGRNFQQHTRERDALE